MNSLLFNEELWSNTGIYQKNDIVYLISGNKPLYFYAKEENTNKNPTGAGSDSWTNEFLWKPSYSTSNEIRPQKTIARFGDGYSQRQRIGLNPSLSSFNVVFNDRDDRESKAILHYLESKAGVAYFGADVFPLYKTGLYYANSINHTLNSPNNNNISFKLVQVEPVKNVPSP